MYDQPAIANPIETQKARDNFRKQSRRVAAGVAVALAIASAYWYTADSLKAEGPEHPQLKGLHETPEEMERKVQKAQKE